MELGIYNAIPQLPMRAVAPALRTTTQSYLRRRGGPKTVRNKRTLWKFGDLRYNTANQHFTAQAIAHASSSIRNAVNWLNGQLGTLPAMPSHDDPGLPFNLIAANSQANKLRRAAMKADLRNTFRSQGYTGKGLTSRVSMYMKTFMPNRLFKPSLDEFSWLNRKSLAADARRAAGRRRLSNRIARFDRIFGGRAQYDPNIPFIGPMGPSVGPMGPPPGSPATVYMDDTILGKRSR